MKEAQTQVQGTPNPIQTNTTEVSMKQIIATLVIAATLFLAAFGANASQEVYSSDILQQLESPLMMASGGGNNWDGG